MLHEQVWGNGFEPPLFTDEVEVLSQRIVGEKHLKLNLRHAGQAVDAIWFGRTEPLPARTRIAYRLDINEWQGERKVQFLVEAVG
jgi:single-stranded-DNA-specific exonuclease